MCRYEFAILLQTVLNFSLERLEKVARTAPAYRDGWMDSLNSEERALVREARSQPRFEIQMNWLKRHPVRLCFFGEPDYPSRLLSWSSAPQVLWYVGEPVWNLRAGFAVVGSRNPSSLSLEWISWQLRKFINARELYLVSGGARGVDQAAHWMAVRQSTPTVALMPLGLMSRYPTNFCELEPAVVKTGGAVLSPFVLDWPLHKANFARRNQVIAALSEACLIVEARRRSGTLLTARAAQNLDRPLAVLPCSPVSAQGLGGLDLLCESEAILVRDAEDLCALWDRVGSCLRPTSLHGPDGKAREN